MKSKDQKDSELKTAKEIKNKNFNEPAKAEGLLEDV